MEQIFEKINNILNSLNESAVSLPINPDMTTTEQGKIKAYEKLAKYFYDLSFGGGLSGGIQSNDDIDLPDDFINPKVKGKLDKDKIFDRNKVIWDQDEYDKLDKDVNVNGGDSDDEFDDFDYRDNEFGDDDDENENDNNENGGSSNGNKSESEKLEDEINDAIDKLKDDKTNNGGSNSGNQSNDQSGESSENGQSNEQQGQSGNSQNGQSSESSENGQSNEQQGQSGTQSSGGRTTRKDKKLKELKDALKNGDKQSFDKNVEDLKKGETGEGQLAGESKSNVSDDAFKNDMKNAGFDGKDIEEMSKVKDTDTSKDYDEKEIEKLKKEVIDGLEEKCKARGGSALASTIVKNTMKKKIENQEWKKMLELFLKGKAILSGEMAKSRNRVAWGHKNHLWRDAVLPTFADEQGEIQKIYCFVDFSGSVNQDLVYTFLGRVIDLCQKLSYTDVVVYGFSDNLSVPKKINGKLMKSQGVDVMLSQTWDFIQSQNLGSGEQFKNVAEEMLSIWRKDKDSVFLIFGDGEWSTENHLKNCPPKILNNVCVLMYYMDNAKGNTLAGMVAKLRELIGIRSIITTKGSSIRE